MDVQYQVLANSMLSEGPEGGFLLCSHMSEDSSKDLFDKVTNPNHEGTNHFPKVLLPKTITNSLGSWMSTGKCWGIGIGFLKEKINIGMR